MAGGHKGLLFRYLHGDAMDGTMLPHDDRRVERDDLTVGEGGLYDAKGFLVFYRLVVDWKDDGAVDDEKVGISGGKPLTLIHHGIGHGELQESVRLAFRGTKRLQLFFQGTEIGVLGIVLVLTSYVRRCRHR